MIEPRTPTDLFPLIQKQVPAPHPNDSPKRFYSNRTARNAQVQKHITDLAPQFPIMQNQTVNNYIALLEEVKNSSPPSEKCEPAPEKPNSAQEFWKAALDFNPVHERESKLVALQTIWPGASIELGMLYGQTKVWLIPTLDTSPGYDCYTYAGQGIKAIIYPDGHPSAAYSPGGLKYNQPIHPRDDQILRRFYPLGWLCISNTEPRITADGLSITGHMLVMDMDTGRERHPWIVLAKRRPCWVVHLDECTLQFPGEREGRYDEWGGWAEEVRGVLPGDGARTVVARVRGMHDCGDEGWDRSFLRRFGEGFEWTLECRPGERRTGVTRGFVDFHPCLADVSKWYEGGDKEEVCYAEDGVVYMRYKRDTKTYTYPNLDAVPVVGKNAVHGEVVHEAAELEPLMVRFGGMSLGELAMKQLQRDRRWCTSLSSRMGDDGFDGASVWAVRTHF